ncbi:MAG: molybdopterin molybdotransferase MoeA [Burkholderiales bacterium]|nr:molybdopterin molybdotransferase MoeA [Burkholderiales bacterium]MDE2452023.1 molybdopterin molybdotransferase MoeA [Burkholderiales bacterium]
MNQPGPSPLAAGDPQLGVDAARAAIAAALRPIEGSETVPLLQAGGRVLAADLVSPIDVPAHDNSAMDGYAFVGSALAAEGPSAFSVVATVYAGQPFDGAVGAGECVRIMTGAVMPAGLDTVVPQELCRAESGRIVVEAGVMRRGENRRRRGEDLAAGKPALRAGRLLKPADIGLAASLGFEALEVKRRLRVALFSTGDELRAPGQALDPGCIFDSNRFALLAALQRLGFEAIDLGLVRDDPAALEAAFETAMASADAVLTSGGVSVGDADYTRALLARLGEVAFWKVAMRPGRPFAFGPLRGRGERTSWLFALPGNPVAALVTFYVFAREALLQLAGAVPQPLPLLRARCTSPIRKRPGRTEFQRGVVAPAPEGGWQVGLTGAQGAGILRSMSEANALVVLGHDQGSVAAGDAVDVWLFDGLT